MISQPLKITIKQNTPSSKKKVTPITFVTKTKEEINLSCMKQRSKECMHACNILILR